MISPKAFDIHVVIKSEMFIRVNWQAAKVYALGNDAIEGGMLGLETVDQHRNGDPPDGSALHVQAIVKIASEEMQCLIEQRAEITKRILIIRRTIAGLCSLSGVGELSDDLPELLNRKSGTSARCLGLTQACRTVLMKAGRPMITREVCEQIQQLSMPGFQCPRNLVASATVVLRRLVQYGQACKIVCSSGHTAWQWATSEGDRDPHGVSCARIVAEDD
jgi:hypothetical protein